MSTKTEKIESILNSAAQEILDGDWLPKIVGAKFPKELLTDEGYIDHIVEIGEGMGLWVNEHDCDDSFTTLAVCFSDSKLREMEVRAA